MALDPQAKALLDQVAAAGIPSLETLSLAEARDALARMATMRTGATSTLRHAFARH